MGTAVTPAPPEPASPAIEPAHAAGPPAPSPWRRPRNWLIVLAAIWLLTGFYLVPADEQAVLTTFGQVTEERVGPGAHVTWPWPVARVYRLKVRQQQRAIIGGSAPDAALGRRDGRRSQFLTGDQNVINVRAVAQYSVATPREYLFEAEEVNRAVQISVEAELAREIANRSVDDVLTTEKVAIQEAVLSRAQGLLDGYSLGVALSAISIEEVAAPPEAADAFRDVSSARSDAARIVSEAQGYANDIVPRARGEATTLLAGAEAYKERAVNRALGDAARFQQLAREYERARTVTERRLYLETMEEILPRFRKTIVDDDDNLDLTLIRKSASTP